MKIHRFYVGSNFELEHDFWLKDYGLLHQWVHVLRFQPGQQVVLFDGVDRERLYKIVEINEHEAHLTLVTELIPKKPKKDMFLIWSLLKKDKNDWVLQKCTELGVSHFIPLLAQRSEKTGFNIERARKIVIEAAEQCGRSDIPTLREPVHIDTLLNELGSKVALYICEQGSQENIDSEAAVGVLIGPEGGWSDGEKELFKKFKLRHIDLHDFTLRAETAAVAAATIVGL